MATRIIFVRHGMTRENELRIMQGAQPTELTPQGRIQAAAAAQALKAYEPVALYSSNYVRACQTADIISEVMGLPVQENTRLREQGLGEWEGKSWPEIAAADPTITERRHSEGWWFCPPGGEPRLRVRHRMLAFIDEARKAHADNVVVAVTHGGALYFLAHALLDRVPLGRAVLQTHNGSFTVVDADDERTMLISLNCIQHLQGLPEE
jgi:broad specificity phosphatase PhoE